MFAPLRRLALVAAAAGAVATLVPAAAHADLAFDQMKACSDRGPKPPGSTAGRAQADSIAASFRGAGLQTTFEDFHLPVHVVRKVELATLGDGARTVPGETFAYGGAGRVEADVVDVGTGRASDYAGKDVKGKIVMVNRDEAFHRSSQLTEIVAHGGAAMLYVSGSPDNLIQTGTVRFAQKLPAPIPTVTVGKDDGTELRGRLEDRGLRMRIAVDAERQDATGRNVVGVRRGTTHPDKTIVVGGHYDNWHHGAVDNCSAVGTMLSVADAVKDVPLDYTVVFGAWDAEEVGLTGSYDWVARHHADLGDVVTNINLEMTAAEPNNLALRFGTNSPAMLGVANTAGVANGYTATNVPAVAIRQISGGIIPTDLQPFYSSGVQGFSSFTSTPYYHTKEDLPARVDAASLTRVSAYARDALLGLQSVPAASLQQREVPEVTVSTPATATPGAAVPVEIRVKDASGAPLSGEPVQILVNQRNHWAVLEGDAQDVGAGVYRFTIPAGVTDSDLTSITATVNRPEYIAEGYETVDQRSGGLLPPADNACASRGVVRIRVRNPRRAGRIKRLSARATGARVRIVRNRTVVLDLRKVRRTVTLKIRARTTRGRLVRQKRVFPPCATQSSLRQAAH